MNTTPDQPENSSPARVLVPLVLLLGLSFVLVADCGREENPSDIELDDDDATSAASDGAVDKSDTNLAYLDEIAALGYVDFADDSGANESADAGSGVTKYVRDLAWPGVNFYTSLPDSAAFLVDMDGNVLHSWRDRFSLDTRWTRVELLDNGDVICISPKENYLVRMSWNGDIVWRRPIDAHHDVRVLPDGNLLVLTRNLRRIPEVHEQRYSVDNSLSVFDQDGRKISEHSLWDILSSDPEIPIRAPEHIVKMPDDVNVDPIHCNTAVPMTSPELAARNPIFALGNVLVTLRYPCTLAIVHPETERVIWKWGADELQGPHEANVMENGHILVLDNGWIERGYSRVIELDPETRQIVWEYVAPLRESFFTAGRGTVQALPNGNVLVGNSNSGEAFEVTRSGDVVWRFLNPNKDLAGKRAVLRIRRFDQETIDAIRARAGAD